MSIVDCRLFITEYHHYILVAARITIISIMISLLYIDLIYHDYIQWLLPSYIVYYYHLSILQPVTVSWFRCVPLGYPAMIADATSRMVPESLSCCASWRVNFRDPKRKEIHQGGNARKDDMYNTLHTISYTIYTYDYICIYIYVIIYQYKYIYMSCVRHMQTNNCSFALLTLWLHAQYCQRTWATSTSAQLPDNVGIFLQTLFYDHMEVS